MTDRRFLALLLAAQAVLLIIGLGTHALWLDEVMSLNAAAAEWPAMARFFRYLPEQHPLYYILLRGWLVFGTSEAALRSFSVVTALATTPALFVLTRRLFDSATARRAAALLACSPFFLYFAQEARMYCLLTLTAILATHAFVALREDPRSRNVALYGVACLLGVYTHFFFIFLMFGHTVAALVLEEPTAKWRRFRRLLAVQVAVGVAYLPWAMLILADTRSGQPWKDVGTVIFGVPYTLLRFSVGYAVLLANYGWKARVLELATQDALLLVPAALIFGTLFCLGVREAFDRGWSGRLAVVGLVAPIAAALLASVAIILVGERYFIVSFPMFLVLLALGLERAGRSEARIVRFGSQIGLVLVTAAALGAYYVRPTFGRGQWDEVVATAERLRLPGEPVYVIPRETLDPIRYYLARSGGDSASYLDMRLAPERADSGAVWLVVNGYPPEAFTGTVPGARLITHRQLFEYESGIWLVRLSASPSVEAP